MLSQKLGSDYIQLISTKDSQSFIESPLEILEFRGEQLFEDNKVKIE
jgi:hypothetical protein